MTAASKFKEGGWQEGLIIGIGEGERLGRIATAKKMVTTNLGEHEFIILINFCASQLQFFK